MIPKTIGDFIYLLFSIAVAVTIMTALSVAIDRANGSYISINGTVQQVAYQDKRAVVTIKLAQPTNRFGDTVSVKTQNVPNLTPGQPVCLQATYGDIRDSFYDPMITTKANQNKCSTKNR